MTVWFVGNRTFTKPFSYEDEGKNVVVAGDFKFDQGATIKVKNLVFLRGCFKSPEDITCSTTADIIIYSGLISSKKSVTCSAGGDFLFLSGVIHTKMPGIIAGGLNLWCRLSVLIQQLDEAIDEPTIKWDE